ncbi:type II toxin-antitoxin system HicB family antitoxin [Rhodoplanes sp. SY1]|uniref:type II toxin-antitoxin system HicB family antitoxin n=1 Tax=Rhodoplanes sp. SY1 TaxID=3166646 RepID=UPI0038B62E41
MNRYVAVVDGEAGAYGVVFPDLPGCTSGGATLDEAMRNAAEAARLWAEEMRAQDGEIPVPRSAEDIARDPDIAADLRNGAILTAVPMVLDSGRPAKANISLDAGLLAAIDAAAAERRLTRSAFLASAAREKIESGG